MSQLMSRFAFGLALFFGSIVASAHPQDKLPESRAQAVSEVLVIGEAHSPGCFLMDEAYSPAHVRAVLNKYQPTAVAIESSPLLFSRDLIPSNVYSGKYVALPWALSRNVPAYGVDWQEFEGLVSFSKKGLEQARKRTAQEPPKLAEKQTAARFISNAVFSSYTKDLEKAKTGYDNNLFYWYNSQEYSRHAWGKYWDAIESGITEADEKFKSDREIQLLRRIDYRDEQIARNLLAILRRHRGCRLAVVIGAGHKGNLEKKLSVHSDIRIVPLARLVPLTKEELDRAWAPIDALAGLRENLDSRLFYFNEAGISVERVRKMLDRLKAAKMKGDEISYFEARLRAIERDYPQAQRLLNKIVSEGRKEKFSYALTVDWGLDVSQMARIELGRIHDLLGARDTAIKQYREVLDEIEKSAPTIPDESRFKSSEMWITDGWEIFGTVYSYQESRDLLRMLLQEPYALLKTPSGSR